MTKIHNNKIMDSKTISSRSSKLSRIVRKLLIDKELLSEKNPGNLYSCHMSDLQFVMSDFLQCLSLILWNTLRTSSFKI